MRDPNEHGLVRCDDGLDNDADGVSDFQLSGGDPGCSSATDTSEVGTLACDNNLDDDGDGYFDFSTNTALSDPGCTAPGDSDEHQSGLVCDNGDDDDSDTKIDFRIDGNGDSCCADPLHYSERCNCMADAAGGTSHTCIVKKSGTAFCWGANGKGQLGTGTTTPSLVPVAVSMLTTGVEIGAGEAHTCARRFDGTVVCWGENKNGQCGDGTGNGTRMSPVAVMNLAATTSLGVGANHSCATDNVTGGSTWCWGENGSGQLGDNSTTEADAPVRVMGLAGAIEVAAGGSHSCARRPISGTSPNVQCWGLGTSGQLGQGMNATSLVPVTVNISDVAELALGLNHSCARRGDGTVWCWGLNANGQLGNNSTTNRNVPVAVSGLTNVVDIAAGNAFTCARRSDGTVMCWGANGSGQLGNNSTTQSLVPVPVASLALAEGLGLGATHACSFTDSETTMCWGENMAGQLGNNSTMDRSVPVLTQNLTCP